MRIYPARSVATRLAGFVTINCQAIFMGEEDEENNLINNRRCVEHGARCADGSQ